MSEDWFKPQNLDLLIIQTLKKNKPNTVDQLVKQVQIEYAVPKQRILERILHLRDQGKILFKEYSSLFTFKSYMLSSKSNWYWIIIALSVATTALVFTVSENAHPVVYALYVLGSVFILLLPGYALIKALFPAKELDNIERIGLSIGMSLAVVIIAGLFLNSTPWGIRTVPVTLSLLTLTIVFATTAIIRECQTKLR